MGGAVRFDNAVCLHGQAQDQWLRERVLVKLEDARLGKVSFWCTRIRLVLALQGQKRE